MKKLTITLLLLLAFSLHGQSPKANTDPALPFKAVKGMSMDEVVAAQGKPTMIDDADYKKDQKSQIKYFYEGVEWQGLKGQLVFGFNRGSNFNASFIYFYPYTKDKKLVSNTLKGTYKHLTADEYIERITTLRLKEDPTRYDSKEGQERLANFKKLIHQSVKEGDEFYSYKEYRITPRYDDQPTGISL